MRVNALVVVLKLWGWLSGTGGLHAYAEVHPSLRALGSPRTVQRWLSRALPKALKTQDVLRRAVIEFHESQPEKTLFPGGLSPPDDLHCRPWQDHDAIVTLWRGLALLLGGAWKLQVSPLRLLVEARRRWTEPESYLV